MPSDDDAKFEISGEQIVFRLRRRETSRRAYFHDDNWLVAVRSVMGEAKWQRVIRATLDAEAGDRAEPESGPEDLFPPPPDVPTKDDSADMTAAVLSLIQRAKSGISNKELLSELMARPAFNVKLSRNTNYLYTVLGRLEQRGEIRREGRQNFPVDKAEPEGLKLTLEMPTAPRIANGAAARGDA